jgi:hypothetical protein
MYRLMRLPRSLSVYSGLAKGGRKFLFRISTDKLAILKDGHDTMIVLSLNKNVDVLSV